jgi:hypothetical protein
MIFALSCMINDVQWKFIICRWFSDLFLPLILMVTDIFVSYGLRAMKDN